MLILRTCISLILSDCTSPITSVFEDIQCFPYSNLIILVVDNSS